MGTEIKLTTNIVVNGRRYASVDEMPADVRALYERALPSAPRSGADPLLNVAVKSKARFVVNGQEYSSVADMPPAVRRLYQQAIRQAVPRILSWVTGILLLAWLVVIVVRRVMSAP